MQAETIELLSAKGEFSMKQSLVLAEAMDQVIEKAQFVTVPILDARLATVTARIDVLEGKMDARFASVDARFDSMEAKFDAKFERWTIRIIIATVLSQAALGPMGVRVFDSMRQVIATLGH
jgi:hypothetical protein